MRMLCIGGFLGSGKTTLLLRAARHLAAASQTVAVIENEIGEIGVDGQIVSDLGMPVRELFGGCVCCTLQAGLVEALREIEATMSPDWVIVEPTGLASPGDLVDAVHAWAPVVTDIHILTLVDAVRFSVLKEMAEPLIEAQIKAAEVVAVNKIDQVDTAVVDAVVHDVAALNPSATTLAISATQDGDLGKLFEGLLAP